MRGKRRKAGSIQKPSDISTILLEAKGDGSWGGMRDRRRRKDGREDGGGGRKEGEGRIVNLPCLPSV